MSDSGGYCSPSISRLGDQVARFVRPDQAQDRGIASRPREHVREAHSGGTRERSRPPPVSAGMRTVTAPGRAVVPGCRPPMSASCTDAAPGPGCDLRLDGGHPITAIECRRTDPGRPGSIARQRDRDAQGADDDVLPRGLERPGPALDADQGRASQGARLDQDEQQPEVAGFQCREHQRGEQAEEREIQADLEAAELAAVFLGTDVTDGAERREQRHGGHGHREEPAERVHVQEAVPAEQRRAAVQHHQQRQRAAEATTAPAAWARPASRARAPAIAAAGPAAGPAR